MNSQTRADAMSLEETPDDDNLAAFEDDVETVDVDDQFSEYEDEDTDVEPSYDETPSLAVDEALEQLRVDNPAAYKALSGLQEGYTKWNQFSDEVENVRSMQTELQQTLEQLSTEAEEVEDELPVAYTTPSGVKIPEFPEGHQLHGIDQEQWELTHAMMDALGVKPVHEIEAAAEQRANTQAVQAAQDSYIYDESVAGVDAFGDGFGKMVDGKLVLTEEAQAAMRPIHQRLYDPKRGISTHDLHVLSLYANGELLTKEQADNLGAEENEVQQERVTRRRRGTVVSQAPAGRRRPVIYDPKKGDTLADAIKKAELQARREIRVPRR